MSEPTGRQFAGEPLDAKPVLAIGLVTAVVAPDRLRPKQLYLRSESPRLLPGPLYEPRSCSCLEDFTFHDFLEMAEAACRQTDLLALLGFRLGDCAFSNGQACYSAEVRLGLVLLRSNATAVKMRYSGRFLGGPWLALAKKQPVSAEVMQVLEFLRLQTSTNASSSTSKSAGRSACCSTASGASARRASPFPRWSGFFGLASCFPRSRRQLASGRTALAVLLRAHSARVLNPDRADHETAPFFASPSVPAPREPFSSPRSRDHPLSDLAAASGVVFCAPLPRWRP